MIKSYSCSLLFSPLVSTYHFLSLVFSLSFSLSLLIFSRSLLFSVVISVYLLFSFLLSHFLLLCLILYNSFSLSLTDFSIFIFSVRGLFFSPELFCNAVLKNTMFGQCWINLELKNELWLKVTHVHSGSLLLSPLITSCLFFSFSLSVCRSLSLIQYLLSHSVFICLILCHSLFVNSLSFPLEISCSL